MEGETRCKACGKTKESDSDGLKLWDSWWCSKCFMSQSQEFNRPLRPEDVELLKIIGRELAGLLPPDLVEMIFVGYWKRCSGQDSLPSKEETARVVGEMQRLAAFGVFRKTLALLKTWQDAFNEFIEGQEAEIRENIKKLTS